MTTELTKKSFLLSRKTNPEPQMILEIDGITEIFGAIPITKTAKFGDPDIFFGDAGLVFGGTIDHANSRDWIDLDGSTKSLSQQLSNDSTGLASFQTMRVKIVDINQRLSKIFSPGFVVEDILSRQANVYLSFKGAAHPEDSVKIISGLIDAIEFGAGNAVVSVSHPENLKRQKVFPLISREVQNELHYNSITVQDVFYRRRNQLRENLSIEYLDTASAGNETASITGNLITVNIESGVSTADQVEDAIREDAKTSSIVETDITVSTTVQTAFAATPFLKTTTVTLDNASEHILPIDVLKTYILVEDELIEFTGRSGNDLTGCVRGQLNTLPVYHEIGKEASTFYRLEENPITLALKLLLSNGGLPYKSDVNAVNFNQIDSETFIQNAIFFEVADIQSLLGLVQGDKMSITLAGEAANNFTDRLIKSFGIINNGSYIVVDGADLDLELNSPSLAEFTSKYNTLPKNIGLQMNPFFVDVERHESILTTFRANFPDYDIYIKDEKEGSGFINEEIYLPINLFAIPREGKISLNIIKPPLNSANTKTLNRDNVVNPKDIKIKRSINNKFYNAITYRYEQDSLDDKFLAGTVIESETSFKNIPIGLRPLTIDSPGIRKNPNIDTLLLNNGRKQILRYRFGAESFKVQVLYRDGFNSDIGDTVIFDGLDLHMTDTNLGERDFQPRLMEIGNKDMNFEEGRVVYDLIDTAFNLDGRFGVIGPSSKLDSGSTTTEIKIKRSFGTNELTEEIVKWVNYSGLDVRIRTNNLSFDETVNFVRVHPTKQNTLVVSPALSMAPLEDYTLDMPAYDSTSVRSNSLWKSAHCYATPQVAITAGVSTTRFSVDAGDIGKFQVGAFIRLHNDDFTDDSGDTKVDDIIGNDIITQDDIGFVPDITHDVDLIGFGDGGKPYRIL